MEWWQALILGLVEGFTEYLPVSSTGHLVVMERLLGMPADEASNAYAIVIQAGAIAAVVGLYWHRITRMMVGMVGKDPDGGRLAQLVLLAFAPAAIAGVVAGDLVESYLFGPWPIVIAWTLGGFLLLALAPKLKARDGKTVEGLAWKGALLVGFAQCLALWPGVSRSLATILGGLVAGLSLPAAVEFSFLLGLVTLSAASIYKLVGSGAAMLAAYEPHVMVIGFLAAWGSAVLAVKWMVQWLNTRGLGLFGWWRLTAAATVAVLLLSGWL